MVSLQGKGRRVLLSKGGRAETLGWAIVERETVPGKLDGRW